MDTKRSRDVVLAIMKLAGITDKGENPWDIRVHNPDFYPRLLQHPALALGESYMDEWWDCEALDEFVHRALQADLEEKIWKSLRLKWHLAKARLLNLQKGERAFTVGREHYDLGNDLYQAMLDRRMLYTCAYWKDACDLDAAQEAKLELVCRKIGLAPGMKVLDLGCGFGAFARYAAEKYNASVFGVTVSEKQVALGAKLCKGLPVQIKLMDYREVTGSFDRVVSIGIMEHVGYKNYRTYMEKADETLKDGGVCFVHTIGRNDSATTCNAWTHKYIFPNSNLPSVAQLGRAMEGLFVLEDLHNFGPDYDRTCMAWYENFEKAWPDLKDKYGERFRRMWRFYLLSSAGAFRARHNQLWQMVMTRPGASQPECRIS
ncbi:MAG: cyclopropane fatty acyl phospholipid synthase [Thermodesulfobacteriota bacterium]